MAGIVWCDCAVVNVVYLGYRFLINYFNSVGVADFVTWFLLLVVVSWCLFGFACCVLVLIGLCLWLFWMWGGWRVLMLNAGGCYVAVI